MKENKNPSFNKIETIIKSFVPYLQISLQEQQFMALLDSGSVSSILHTKIFKKFNLALLPTNIKCFSATAQPVNIVGAVECKIRVDR